MGSAPPAAPLPAAQWILPGAPEYAAQRSTFHLSNPSTPYAIALPKSTADIAKVLAWTKTYGVPFTIRSGGHDLMGRSVAQDAVVLDMRGLDSVSVAADRKTAWIGGGIQHGKLLAALAPHGLIAPFGSIPSVGFVGWASLGGYGSMSGRCGLGVDQIVGAELFNADGELVTADEELLKGIRGGGAANFGIVVSLQIKVYELEKLLAGALIIDTSSKGIAKSFSEFMTKWQDLLIVEEGQSFTDANIPRELVLQPLVINHPQMGRTFMLSFVWSSPDHELGRKWHNKVLELCPGPVIMDTVGPISGPDWTTLLDSFVAHNMWSAPGKAISRTASFTKMVPKGLDILCRGLEVMPNDLAIGVSIHTLHGDSPSVTEKDKLCRGSVFNPDARRGHYMLELIGGTVDPANAEECRHWMESLRAELRTCIEEEGLMRGEYISLSQEGDVSLEEIYGEDNLRELRRLKSKFDPKDIFLKTGVPRLH